MMKLLQRQSPSIFRGGIASEAATQNELIYTLGYTGTLNAGEIAQVSVTHLLNDTSASDYQVNVVTAIQNAVDGLNGIVFDGTTLTFFGGNGYPSSFDFTVVLADDVNVEATESFSIALSQPTGDTTIAGLTFTEGGLLTWNPTFEASIDVELKVSDDKGAYATQSYTLVAYHQNTPPDISSIPSGPALVDEEWTYQVDASDAENDTLSYTLDAASLSAGLTIDANGLVSWTPTAVGSQSVEITVSDGNGGSAIQSFTLTVIAEHVVNHAPSISSTPVGPAEVGSTWTYNVNASDVDLDPLTYSFTVTQPETPSVSVASISSSIVDSQTVTGDEATFAITGSPSVTEDPNDGDQNEVTYQITFTSLLDPSESASVDVSQIFGDTTSADFSDTLLNALATAASADPSVTLSGSTLTFDGNATYPTLTDYGYAGTASVSSSGTTHWTNSGDAAGNNSSTFATINVDKDDTTEKLRLTNYGFSIPSTATIKGITVTLETDSSVASPLLTGFPVQISKNGTTSSGNPGTTTGTWQGGQVVYGGSTDLWGTTWSPSDINSSNFGVLVAPDLSLGSSDFDVYSAKIDISYEDAIGAGTTILEFTLPINNDSASESSEAFEIVLSNAQTANSNGVVITRESAATTIVDNENALANIVFSISGDGSTTEDSSDADNNEATFTISYTGALNAGEVARVDVIHDLGETTSGDYTSDVVAALTAAANSTEGVDYDGTTLTFYGGSSYANSIEFTVVLNEDVTSESTETYSIQLAPTESVYIPTGMSLSPSGVLTWDATAETEAEVLIRVEDGRGGYATQLFTITSVDPNTPPGITSVPTGPAYVDEEWTYQVEATDLEQSTLDFDIDATSISNGFAIDSNGLITWTPTAELTRTVTVTVSDGIGGSGTQTFTIDSVNRVTINNAPSFTSTPEGPAFTGILWSYQATATDPNEDPLTFTLDQDSLNRGMTIQANGLVEWTPDTEGSYLVAVSVDDGNGNIITQSFTLDVIDSSTINLAPTITSTPRGPAYLTNEWSYQVVATDPNDDPLTYSLDSAALTAGFQVNATGLITWTPTVETEETVIVTVDDGNGAYATQTFTLAAVDTPPPANAAPVISSQPSTQVHSADTYQYQVSAYDPNGDTITYTLVNAPTGMTISATGLITWTAGTVGPYSVSVKVEDPQLASVTQSYTLNVIEERPPLEQNEPPTITSEPKGPAARDRQYQYQVTADDPNRDPITFSLDEASLSRGATIDFNTGLIVWTPTVTGTFEFTVTATDPFGALGTQTFSLPVVENAPPYITSVPSQYTDVDTLYTYSVTAVDPNPGDTFTFSLDSALSGMSIDSETGLFEWTPDSIGVFPITIVVTDNTGASSQQSYELVVRDPIAVNQNPVINSTPRNSIQLGSSFVHQVIATDADYDDLSYSLLSGSPTGMVIDDAGLITWTPDGEDVPTSPHAYTVRVEDGRGGFVEATYALTVTTTAVNSAPEITSTPSLNATTGFVYQYQATATDPEADILTWSLTEKPAGMQINSQTGLITWSPTLSQIGQHTISLKVTDPYGGSSTQTYTLTLRSSNLAPMIDSSPVTEAIAGDLYEYQVEAHDPDGDELTYSLAAYPSGMTINSSTGLIN
ncbi:MAG: putative Ig domain-containing protein [Planctomycetaceae bacterium]